LKIFIFFVLCNILLQASYTKMQNYYQKGQYKSVLKEAKTSFSEYDNPKLHLLWAKSAQKVGKTKEAMGAYERVLILDEHNAEATEALEAIYSQTQRIGLSVNPYEKASNGSLKSKANLALGHDTNVNANPGGDALDEYYGVIGNRGEIASSFIRFNGNLDYTYKFEEAEGWFAKSVLDFYSQSNFSAHKYDLVVGTAELGVGYASNAYSLYLPLSYNAIHYLDKNLLERYRFMPRLIVPIFNESFLDFSAIYSRRAYKHQEDKDNDASTLGLGLGIYFPVMQDLAHVNVKYETRSSDHTVADQFVNADFLSIDASLKHYFNTSFLAEVQYAYRHANYEDDIGTLSIPSSVTRKDDFNQVNIILTYIMKKDFEMYLRNEYADNSSNYMPTQYNKNILMFGINMRY